MPPNISKRAITTRSNSPAQDIPANDLFQHGILSLPNESLLEIVSYFPVIALPLKYADFYDPAVAARGYIRADVLRSLTQTCRLLRKIFLPLLWQRLDVYTRPGEGMWYKQVSRVLKNKSKGLLKNKDLAAYVESCHVVLTRCSTDEVIPSFARCLASLPNLHTLEILHAHSQMTTALKDGFAKKTIPSIRTIILPSCAHNILRCCPEVRSVTCIEENGSKLLGAIAQGCPKVEVLEGFSPDTAMMKRLVKVTPNLQRLKLGNMRSQLNADLIRLLKPLKNLCRLDIVTYETSISMKSVNDCITTAQEILRKMECKAGEKRLTIRHRKVRESGQIEEDRVEEIKVD